MKYLLFFLILSLTSCVTYNRCYKKYGKQIGDSTTKMVVGKADIKLKADSTAGLVSPAELDKLEDGETMEIFDTDVQVDAEPDASLVTTPRKPKLYITRKGNDFQVKAVTPPDTIKVQVKVPCVCPPQIQFEEPSSGWVYFFSGLFVGIVSLFILAFIFK